MLTLTYEYGSPPDDCRDEFVKFLAPKLPPNDKVFHCLGSDWQGDESAEHVTRHLFLCICHWKSNRPKRYAAKTKDENTIKKELQRAFRLIGTQNPPGEANVIEALKILDRLPGVGVRTASAILTAWSPDRLGILDERVANAKVLRITDSLDSPETYVEYLETLRQLRAKLGLSQCSIRQMELALWHYAAIANEGNKAEFSVSD